jgi:hypothetical protein
MLLVIEGLFADFGFLMSDIVLEGFTLQRQSFGSTSTLFADVIAVLLYKIGAVLILL